MRKITLTIGLFLSILFSNSLVQASPVVGTVITPSGYKFRTDYLDQISSVLDFVESYCENRYCNVKKILKISPDQVNVTIHETETREGTTVLNCRIKLDTSSHYYGVVLKRRSCEKYQD